MKISYEGKHDLTTRPQPICRMKRLYVIISCNNTFFDLITLNINR